MLPPSHLLPVNTPQDSALVKIESCMQVASQLQAYERLGLYLETVLQRARAITEAQRKEVPRDGIEAVASLVYASRRMG